MTSAFGKNCPHKGCTKKIVRVTGDPDSEEFSARCEKGHRAKGIRASNGRLTLTPTHDED